LHTFKKFQSPTAVLKGIPGVDDLGSRSLKPLPFDGALDGEGVIFSQLPLVIALLFVPVGGRQKMKILFQDFNNSNKMSSTSVSDLDSLVPDPDPAF
jgi:hypothetical protein